LAVTGGFECEEGWVFGIRNRISRLARAGKDGVGQGYVPERLEGEEAIFESRSNNSNKNEKESLHQSSRRKASPHQPSRRKAFIGAP
jgi:hypothetical protein